MPRNRALTVTKPRTPTPPVKRVDGMTEPVFIAYHVDGFKRFLADVAFRADVVDEDELIDKERKLTQR